MDVITNIELGQHLKKCRKNKGVSGNALAKNAGISQSTISSIEHGHKSPTVLTLDKLCAAMGISLEDFFGGIHQEGRSNSHRALIESIGPLSDESRHQLAQFLKSLK